MGKRQYSRWTMLVAAIGIARLSIAAEPAGSESPTPSPLSPDVALQHFTVHPDLQVELVAAEPQVIDPVAMAFDEHGRLWVVEMRDYPFGPQEGETPQSRIKLLEDRDRDGHYETAHMFADGLLFATGIQPWRGGVIVTLSGEIAWLADTDGDQRADVHETWFRGFAQRNPQLRANDPTFWFDGNI
jgi:putative membrane-bound dehydrogenase-like protein